MFGAAVVGAVYLGIGGSMLGSKITTRFTGINKVTVAKETVGSFPVELPLLLGPGVQWIGGENFTEYHLKAGAAGYQRKCHSTTKKPFEISCFNVTLATFILGHFTPSKDFLCPSHSICSIPLSEIYFPGRKPHFGSRSPRSNLDFSRVTPQLEYMGPAKAKAWSKVLYLKQFGVREYFKAGFLTPGFAENHTTISEVSLPSGFSDSLYGIQITSS
ncbi:hypothetical protein DSO57_1018988 [Entomophthora muscae]|uniref:Uncharacterized protein n=2 Tax=Entomophthora muscae TaxID=34485 RepID=A0ACC2UQ16_9FUNG|nr:hypothetical protein DSO57_1018987 [Entomophthora muscae]KAJ9088860.1 hypothetical protein DSO57_1018988 [Entomophthora muscae]